MNLELIKKKLRETFNFSNFFNMAIYIFGFSYAVNFILNFLNIKLDMFSQIFVLFLLMEIIGKILPKSLNKLSGILSLFRLLFSLNSIFTLSFLWNYIISLFLFQITWLLISFLINYSFAENVKIKDLKPNMALGEKLIKVKNGFEKKEISSVMNIFSILRLVKEELTSSNSISITKLSENDIEVLKKLQKEKKLKFATLQIVKTTPFAPLLLIGVLITCLFEGNLFYYLLPLMSHLHI
jgi:prepilin signal peptidase PulO-like enzyme (type II secretory pathway)